LELQIQLTSAIKIWAIFQLYLRFSGLSHSRS